MSLSRLAVALVCWAGERVAGREAGWARGVPGWLWIPLGPQARLAGFCCVLWICWLPDHQDLAGLRLDAVVVETEGVGIVDLDPHAIRIVDGDHVRARGIGAPLGDGPQRGRVEADPEERHIWGPQQEDSAHALQRGRGADPPTRTGWFAGGVIGALIALPARE